MAISKAYPTDVFLANYESFSKSWDLEDTANTKYTVGVWTICHCFPPQKESCTLHSHISQYLLGVALITPLI